MSLYENAYLLLEGEEVFIIEHCLNFLSDDIENGLLKLKRVGMTRRTLKFNGVRRVEDFIYLPQFKEFVILKTNEVFKE